MTGAQTVQAITEILISGFGTFATGLANGVKTIVEQLFYTTNGDTTTISVYAILILSFAAISICVGLSTKLFNWLQNLGN